jgi:hypothetical protein
MMPDARPELPAATPYTTKGVRLLDSGAGCPLSAKGIAAAPYQAKASGCHIKGAVPAVIEGLCRLKEEFYREVERFAGNFYRKVEKVKEV